MLRTGHPVDGAEREVPQPEVRNLHIFRIPLLTESGLWDI